MRMVSMTWSAMSGRPYLQCLGALAVAGRGEQSPGARAGHGLARVHRGVVAPALGAARPPRLRRRRLCRRLRIRRRLLRRDHGLVPGTLRLLRRLLLRRRRRLHRVYSHPPLRSARHRLDIRSLLLLLVYIHLLRHSRIDICHLRLCRLHDRLLGLSRLSRLNSLPLRVGLVSCLNTRLLRRPCTTSLRGLGHRGLDSRGLDSRGIVSHGLDIRLDRRLLRRIRIHRFGIASSFRGDLREKNRSAREK
jgi:hypothetical protein